MGIRTASENSDAWTRLALMQLARFLPSTLQRPPFKSDDLLGEDRQGDQPPRQPGFYSESPRRPPAQGPFFEGPVRLARAIILHKVIICLLRFPPFQENLDFNRDFILKNR